VATFAARFRVGNLAKDVCDWMTANASSGYDTPKSAPTSPLKNSDVLALKQAGISDSLIIEKIRSSPVKFDLDTTDLVAPKKSGLADAVIAAMLEASRR